MSKRGPSVIVCYSEDELRFEGIYVTIEHAAKCVLPDEKPNTATNYISRYLTYRTNSCFGFVFVRYYVDAPIKTHDIRNDAQPLARKRLKASYLLDHLSRTAVKNLNTQEIDLLYDQLILNSQSS